MSEVSSALSGQRIRSLMRMHGRTIRGLSSQMGITQVRVRRVRLHGVAGDAFVRDWVEAIQSQSG